MTGLPDQLFCIHLAYNIDDRDVVERYLDEYPEETRRCIPTALRHMLESSEFPAIPFFTSRELSKYLLIIWTPQYIDWNLTAAAERGLTYLIPYLLNKGSSIYAEGERAIAYAAQGGYTGLLAKARSDS